MNFLRFLLNGHDHIVTCCAVTYHPNNNLIITGAECGGLCLWNISGQLLKSLVVDSGDISSITCSCINPDLFYVAVGSKIFCYDISLLQENDNPLETLEINEDQINQVVLNDSENYLASSEDSGKIKIYNLKSKKLYKTLCKHTNICSTIAFNPRKSSELFSAGYDQKLMQWNFPKSKAFCIIDIQDVGILPDDLDSYVVSPPFVHSLSINQSGELLSCGCEDAVVYVFDSRKSHLEQLVTLRRHNKGIGQVHFLRFSNNYLVSAGNDARICLWKLDRIINNNNNNRLLYTNGTSHSELDNYSIANGHPHNIMANGSSNNQHFIHDRSHSGLQNNNSRSRSNSNRGTSYSSININNRRSSRNNSVNNSRANNFQIDLSAAGQFQADGNFENRNLFSNNDGGVFENRNLIRNLLNRESVHMNDDRINAGRDEINQLPILLGSNLNLGLNLRAVNQFVRPNNDDDDDDDDILNLHPRGVNNDYRNDRNLIEDLNNLNNNQNLIAANGGDENIGNVATTTSSRTLPIWEMIHTEKINWLASGTALGVNFLVMVDNSVNPVIFTVHL